MNESKPILVSSIIPVYNDEDYIGACLESVLAQTYPYLQILVIDDGSTDNTAAIIDRYAAKDKRIEAIHTAQKGVSNARNIGLNQMKGEYLFFVDSDDHIAPQMVEHLLNYAHTNQLELVLFGALVYQSDNSIVKSLPYPTTQILDEKEVKSRMYRGDISAPIWDKFYHRCVWENLRFDIKWLRGQDYVIQNQYFYRSHSIGCLAELLYHYELRRSRGTFPLSYHLSFQYGIIKQRLAFVEKYDRDYVEDVQFKLIRLSLNLWHLNCIQPDKYITPIIAEIRTCLRKALNQSIFNQCSKKHKLMLLMHRYMPYLYTWIIRFYFKYLEPRQYNLLKKN